MARTIASPTQEIVNKIEGLHTRLTPIEGLLKALAEPAQRSGLSPEALLARMVSQADDKRGIGFTPGDDGARLMTDHGKMFHKGIGSVSDPRTGQRASFNEFLSSLYSFADYGANGATKQVKYLESLGVQRVMQGKDGHVEKAALAESSGVTGGYTVPPMFANQLMTLAIEDTIVAPRAAKQPLTSRTLQVPSLDITTGYGAGVSPFLGGVLASWTTEAATRSESEPQFRQTVLTAWELSFYTIASNTLLADNAVGLDSLLTQLFSAAIGWYTDYAFLRGDGVGKPLGILNAPATITVTKAQAGHFNWYDVGNMLTQLYWLLRGSSSVAWVINQSVITDLYRMNDQSGGTTGVGTGRVLFVPIDRGSQADIPQSAGLQSIGWLAGFPVLVSEKLPPLGTTGCVVLADFSKYLLGTRQELQIDVSPHVNFLKNQMTWRVVWRGDGQPWLNNSITLADNTTKVSPFLIWGS